MTATYAHQQGARACPKGDSELPLRLAALVRTIFPTKTVANVMAEFGVSETTAKNIKRGQYWPCGRVLSAMLASKHGYLILSEIMGDAAEPDWWTVFRRAKRLADAEARLEALRLDIEDLAERHPVRGVSLHDKTAGDGRPLVEGTGGTVRA